MSSKENKSGRDNATQHKTKKNEEMGEERKVIVKEN
jgi:hypothetical protein